jgi:hypothetical protein
MTAAAIRSGFAADVVTAIEANGDRAFVKEGAAAGFTAKVFWA